MQNVKSINWEELVDSYVDNECSEEERQAIEAKAASDARIRESIEWARFISKGLGRLRDVETPAELSGRIQKAIESADLKQIRGGSAGDAAGWSRGGSKPGGKFWQSPKAVGAAATSAAVLVGALAASFWPGSNDRAVSEPDVQSQMAGTNGAVITPKSEPTVYIRTPGSEGQAPESVAKRDSNEAFWVYVTLSDEGSLKSRLNEFQGVCNDLDVDFSKKGVEGAYILNGVDGGLWNQISEKLNTFGECSESDALARWQEESPADLHAVRVVFKTGSGSK